MFILSLKYCSLEKLLQQAENPEFLRQAQETQFTCLFDSESSNSCHIPASLLGPEDSVMYKTERVTTLPQPGNLMGETVTSSRTGLRYQSLLSNFGFLSSTLYWELQVTFQPAGLVLGHSYFCKTDEISIKQMASFYGLVFYLFIFYVFICFSYRPLPSNRIFHRSLLQA